MQIQIIIKNFLLLTIVSVTSINCFSQKIVIIGEANDEKTLELEKIITSISNLKLEKKIKIFCKDNPVPFSIINRKSLVKDLNTLKGLIKYACLSKRIISESEVFQLKSKLNNPKSTIYTYNNIGNTDVNNYTSLTSYLNNIAINKSIKKNDIFLIVFSKRKPLIEITSPKNKTTIHSIDIKGTSIGFSSEIAEIYVRVNNKNWETANGTDNWEINLPNPLSNNSKLKIEAFAIDSDGDSSDIHIVKEVKYEHVEISPNFITYISPNSLKNMTQKCLDREHRFKFKFSINDKNIDLNYLYLRVENEYGIITSNNKTLGYFTTIQDKNGIPILNTTEDYKGENTKDYCFMPSWSYPDNFNSTCEIDIESTYYYYFTYEKDPNNIIKSEKILIHFSSFDNDNEKRTCNCD